MDSPHAITVRGLAKRYGRKTALAGLDLDVPAGSVLGLIGHNGAGKSTCLRILAGLVPATAGQALVAGLDVVHHPRGVRGLVGYMPDQFGVYDDLTALEYLLFYAAATGVPPARRRAVVADLLELVRLTARADDWVMQLSLGMRQRLSLARALLHDPPVLLLDEPASGLDPLARVELRELLGELRAMGKTVVVSSHILPDLAEVCTHAAILAGGRTVAFRALRDEGQPTRALELEVVGPADPHVHALSAQPGVTAVQADGASLRARFAGDAAARAELLRALVAAGVPVAGLRVSEDTLEQLFLRTVPEEGVPA